MLRWLFYLVLALWASRLVRLIQPGPGRREMSDFHPGGGGGHPATPPRPARKDDFADSDIVDAEFEDVPARRQP